MKKEALGLNDIAIPGVPYENRMGMTDADLAISNRFFGKESPINDEKMENDDPIVFKRRTSFEDGAYEEDLLAKKYFDWLLKLRDKKKKQKQPKDLGQV